jgi:hypothetical protein
MRIEQTPLSLRCSSALLIYIKSYLVMREDAEYHSWIVKFWAGVFGFLAYISLFALLRKCFSRLRSNYAFVEYYVSINTLFSVISLIIVTYRRNYEENILLLVVMLYGFFRTFEIFIYQVNVLLFDEYRASLSGKNYAVRGYRRIVILLLHNYFEIVCWFGVSYMWFYRSGHIVGVPEPTFLRVFHESLLLMFSYNPDQYAASTDPGIAIFSVHAVIGLFMNLMVIARFIAVLPSPKTMDGFEVRSVQISQNSKNLTSHILIKCMSYLNKIRGKPNE